MWGRSRPRLIPSAAAGRTRNSAPLATARALRLLSAVAVCCLCGLCGDGLGGSLLPAVGAMPVVVPVNMPLPSIPRVWLRNIGDQYNLRLLNDTLTVNNIPNSGSIDPYRLRYNAPLFEASFAGRNYTGRLVAPTVVLATPVFRVKLLNNLPYQTSCGCGCTVNGDPTYCDACVEGQTPNPDNNPLGVYNGFHDLLITNLHTHGLKIDPGANRIFDLDVCRDGIEAGGDACDPGFDAASVDCEIYGDNVYASVLPGGMTGRNTYIIPPMVPGLHWYHDHEHGSVAYLTPTTNGQFIVPDINPFILFAPPGVGRFKDWRGLRDWHDWQAEWKEKGDLAGGDQTMITASWTDYKNWDPDTETWDGHLVTGTAARAAWLLNGASPRDISRCADFIEVISRFPNFSPRSEVLTISGLWFRKNIDGDPDDDTQPFIGCNALPPSPLECPGGIDNTTGAFGLDPELLDNREGVDYAPINGVLQPTIKLEAGRFKRWQISSTFTQKWLDLTIRELPSATGQGLYQFGDDDVIEDCTLYLLAHDGVYLESVPRVPRSSNTTADQLRVNNLVLGPANRADVLVKCKRPGRYALVSGAGPFDTSPLCAAVHCECYGGSINWPFSGTNTTGNNNYRGRPLSAALMAVIEVEESDEHEEEDLEEDVCRTRLELFQYTDVDSFSNTTIEQCVDLVNTLGGAMCSVNGVLFGDIVTRNRSGLLCLDQGTRQVWNNEGVAFHPAHLHETPVRTLSLPPCLSRQGISTNFWKVGDWFDTVFIPACQFDPSELAGDRVNVEFAATVFPPAPRNFSTDDRGSLRAQGLLYLTLLDAFQTDNPVLCEDRFSVHHCHHLSHEDEGCMAVVYWPCRGYINGSPNPVQCGPPATCPGPDELDAMNMQTIMEGHHHAGHG